MFGFLKPSRHSLSYRRYRQAYARVCRFQKLAYGTESLLFLSYEAVFLYLLAVDSRSIPAPGDDEVTCCRLRTRGCQHSDADAAVARFCAAFGLLLTQTKLVDDVRDRRSLAARWMLWRLKRRMVANDHYLRSLDPELSPAVEAAIERHLLLERQHTAIDIEQYAQPTADAFAAVFRGAASLLPELDAEWLQRAGGHLGTAIIAFDCAVDWARDRRTGQFNPLADQAAVRNALSVTGRSISELGWMCNDDLSGTLAADVLRGMVSRLATVRSRLEKQCVPPLVVTPVAKRVRSGQPLRRATRWLAATGRAGFCDCDCVCNGCDCPCAGCDCGGGAEEAGSGCPSCGNHEHASAWLCCLPCEFCGDCLPCDRPEKKNKTKAATAAGQTVDESYSVVGKVATVATPLTPIGMVRIEGQEYAAKSESGMVKAGETVQVIREEVFGVVVR